MLFFVIFYIVFWFSRGFCGGFHAHSVVLCKVTFMCVLILVLIMDLVLNNIESYYWFVLYLYSLIIVCAFAPVDNPNKRLTSYDIKRCKIISIILMVVWLVVMILFYSFDSKLYHIVALTLFFVANLMLLGKYNERGKTKWRIQSKQLFWRLPQRLFLGQQGRLAAQLLIGIVISLKSRRCSKKSARANDTVV